MTASQVRKWFDGCWKDVADDHDSITACRVKAEKLLERSRIVVFIHLDANGLPTAKAMLAAAKDGLEHIWFSTNASSGHVMDVRRNPSATVYLYDPETYEGVMLRGRAQEEQDQTWREKLWEDGCEKYYSGVNDPEYFILRFDAEWANYYQGGMNITFSLRADDRKEESKG